ncbi:MAG: hypothetical protein AABY15_02710 [Nanoarchaeota archaeon]
METNDIIVKERKIVSFREVHQELENESLFLKKAHDISGYQKKASFLNNSGFHNAIASKLYSSISKNSEMIGEYERKYHGQYKFILKPQLERLCEKYNLFVRLPEHFLGDIPENNIKEMMNFGVYIEDLLAPAKMSINTRNNRFKKRTESGDRLRSLGEEDRELQSAWRVIDADISFFRNPSDAPQHKMQAREHLKEWLSENREFFDNRIDLQSDNFGYDKNPLSGVKVKMNNLLSLGFAGTIQIAAVEGLFSPIAFQQTKARVPGIPELIPRSQVDLDPIVLCETKHGYIVVTAWGDEANDELIINPNKN